MTERNAVMDEATTVRLKAATESADRVHELAVDERSVSTADSQASAFFAHDYAAIPGPGRGARAIQVHAARVECTRRKSRRYVTGSK